MNFWDIEAPLVYCLVNRDMDLKEFKFLLIRVTFGYLWQEPFGIVCLNNKNRGTKNAGHKSFSLQDRLEKNLYNKNIGLKFGLEVIIIRKDFL